MLPTAFNSVPLKGVPSAIAAGVAQVAAACRCSVMVSGAVTLVEKVGLETFAETVGVVLAAPPVAFAATLTVMVTESLAPAAMPVVVQVKVPTVQIQAPAVSVMAVAVRPVGRTAVRTTELSSASGSAGVGHIQRNRIGGVALHEYRIAGFGGNTDRDRGHDDRRHKVG